MALVIWLDFAPVDAPSRNPVTWWNGEPFTAAAPRSVPQPRGPFDAARCPPQSRSTLLGSEPLTVKLTVIVALSSPPQVVVGLLWVGGESAPLVTVAPSTRTTVPPYMVSTPAR